MSQMSSMRRRLDPSAVAKARRFNEEHGPEWLRQRERKADRMMRRALGTMNFIRRFVRLPELTLDDLRRERERAACNHA